MKNRKPILPLQQRRFDSKNGGWSSMCLWCAMSCASCKLLSLCLSLWTVSHFLFVLQASWFMCFCAGCCCHHNRLRLLQSTNDLVLTPISIWSVWQCLRLIVRCLVLTPRRCVSMRLATCYRCSATIHIQTQRRIQTQIRMQTRSQHRQRCSCARTVRR